jgi:hypothetical protein
VQFFEIYLIVLIGVMRVTTFGSPINDNG